MVKALREPAAHDNSRASVDIVHLSFTKWVIVSVAVRADHFRVEYSDMFYLVGVGQSRWRIVHRITDVPAGNIARRGSGFVLRDDEEREIGGFD